MTDDHLKSTIRAELFPPPKTMESGVKVVDHLDLQIEAVIDDLMRGGHQLEPTDPIITTLKGCVGKIEKLRALVDAKRWNEF